MDFTRNMQKGKGSQRTKSDQISIENLMGSNLRLNLKRFAYKEGVCKSVWMAD